MRRSSYPAIVILALFATLSACTTSPSTSAIDGTWDFTMSSPFGAVSATVTMVVDGGTLNGSFDLGTGRTWQIEEGVVNGDEISFRIDRDGSSMIYDMTATVDGDSVTGAAAAMGAEVPWTMTRRN